MEQFIGTFNVQGIIQTFILVGTIVYSFGTANARLNALDKKVDKLDNVLISIARQDERMASMDQRMLAQGKRIDRLDYARRSTSKEETEND